MRVALVLFFAVFGIGAEAWKLARLKPQQLCGADFPVFYAGGLLAGTPELYSAAAAQAIQTRVMGCTTPSAIFIRLPYFAGLMRPWTRVPFWQSFTLWRLTNVVAIGLFVWLWPAPREWSLLACALSLPVNYLITNGQDSGFLLLWIALAMLFERRGLGFAAGLALAMCAAKFHLFLLLPLLVFGQRLYRLGIGLLAGGGALLVACFAVQGRDWPSQFLAAATDRRIDPAPEILFNVRGMAHGSAPIEAILAVAVIAAVIYVCFRGDLRYAFCATLTGGLLLSHHHTASDAVLLLPVALTLAFDERADYSKLVAIFLVSPLAYFMVMGRSLADVPRALLFVLVALLAWEVRNGHGQGLRAAGRTGDGRGEPAPGV